MMDENSWQYVSLMSILLVQICYKRRKNPSEKGISPAQPSLKGPTHVSKPDPKVPARVED